MAKNNTKFAKRGKSAHSADKKFHVLIPKHIHEKTIASRKKGVTTSFIISTALELSFQDGSFNVLKSDEEKMQDMSTVKVLVTLPAEIYDTTIARMAKGISRNFIVTRALESTSENGALDILYKKTYKKESDTSKKEDTAQKTQEDPVENFISGKKLGGGFNV